jgi:hypothetical protein
VLVTPPGPAGLAVGNLSVGEPAFLVVMIEVAAVSWRWVAARYLVADWVGAMWMRGCP